VGTFRELRDSENKRLTDTRLVELAAAHHPWIPGAYRVASGWVHLSPDHLRAVFHSKETTDREGQPILVFDGGIPISAISDPAGGLADLLDAMTRGTAELFASMEVWESRKGLPRGQTRDITSISELQLA